MGIAAQNLFKRNLVADSRSVESSGAIGKGHDSPALQPSRNGRYQCRVPNVTGSCQRQVVVYFVTLKRRQASRSSRDGRLLADLLRDRDGRLLGDNDAVFRAARPVP